jgi:hypothetical protein
VAEGSPVKALAVIDLAAGAPTESIRGEIMNEVKGSWGLFAAGALREAYLTETPTRAVFVLEADSKVEAETHLRGLPLVALGVFRLELMELEAVRELVAPLRAVKSLPRRTR